MIWRLLDPTLTLKRFRISMTYYNFMDMRVVKTMSTMVVSTSVMLLHEIYQPAPMSAYVG